MGEKGNTTRLRDKETGEKGYKFEEFTIHHNQQGSSQLAKSDGTANLQGAITESEMQQMKAEVNSLTTMMGGKGATGAVIYNKLRMHKQRKRSRRIPVKLSTKILNPIFKLPHHLMEKTLNPLQTLTSLAVPPSSTGELLPCSYLAIFSTPKKQNPTIKPFPHSLETSSQTQTQTITSPNSPFPMPSSTDRALEVSKENPQMNALKIYSKAIDEKWTLSTTSGADTEMLDQAMGTKTLW